MPVTSRREFMGLLSSLPFVGSLMPTKIEKLSESQSVRECNVRGGMKFVVHFRRNTEYDHGVRAVVNHPFLRSRAKSIPIRLKHGPNEDIYRPNTIEQVEIFIRESLASEVPPYFIGELKILSPRILRVERA